MTRFQHGLCVGLAVGVVGMTCYLRGFLAGEVWMWLDLKRQLKADYGYELVAVEDV